MPAKPSVAGKCGDDRAVLEALLRRLAVEIDATRNPHVVAALAPQLVKVLVELAKLRPPAGSRVDEIAKQRKARQAAVHGR
jgi:hypothetical protein